MSQAGVENVRSASNSMDNAEVEEWRGVRDCPMYEVSNLGKIRNLRSGRILKGNENAEGYVSMILCSEGTKKRTTFVHVYVAEVFIPNPEGKPTVNHKNHVRNDNRATNLEWATSAEQNRHKRKHGSPVDFGTRPIWKCDKTTGDQIERYESSKLAALSISSNADTASITTAISIAIRGFYMVRGSRRNKDTAYGFRWELAENILPGEVWKDIDPQIIKGGDGYAISNLGRIKSRRGAISTPRNGPQGYINTSIVPPDKSDAIIYKYFVHVLVAKMFIPNPLNLPVVNHKDGDRKNNNISNLEWVTREQNSQHAYDTGLNTKARAVRQLTLGGELVEEFRSEAAAYRKTGVRGNNICNAIKGNRPMGGFRWQYIEGDISHLHEKGDYKIATFDKPPPALRVVQQLDREGNVVAEFPSGMDAQRSTEISGINMAIKNLLPCGGFYWRHKPGEAGPSAPAPDPSAEAPAPSAAAPGPSSLPPQFLPSRKERPTQQLDMKGTVVAEFYSIKEASDKTGINASTIYDSICTKTPGIGWYWRHKPADPDEPWEPAPNYQSRAIRQLTKDTPRNLIAEFPSISAAVIATGIKQGTISYGLKVTPKPSVGFVWEYVNPEKPRAPPKEKAPKAVPARVQQWSVDGKFIAEFETIRQASEATGVSGENIRPAMKRGMVRGGFIWKPVECFSQETR